MKPNRKAIFRIATIVGVMPIVSACIFAASPSSPTAPVRSKLEAFGYGQVVLRGGPFDAQASAARSFYLNLSEDSLLQGFRLRAGLPAPGKPMGGWYDPDGFAGAHPFGQFVSALSRMYASTGDAKFKQKVARLVHGFKETLAPDGFFYSSQKVAREWPCYLYDKNCIGMRDAFTLTGNKEALTVLSRMTDWAVSHLPRRSDEWYTLPENLFNCFALTGERRYLDLAKEYDYSAGFYDAFAQGKNAFSPDLHAYSHVNTLCSAAKIYEATGDPKYFRSLENAWRFLTTTQMYASGGWGPDERFVEAGSGKLAASLTSTGQGFETPCGTFANVNLDRYMLRFTGESQYGDNMERVLYNGMLAALPPLPDGHSFYYSDYRPGAKKIRRSDLWTCCSGTFAQATSDYPLDIYFHDSDNLYVNLFVSSEVRWPHGAGNVIIRQSTDYPRTFSTKLVVSNPAPGGFGLDIRVPKWATSAPIVSINGAPVAQPRIVRGFVHLDRHWRKGDTVSIGFPSSPRFEPIAPETPDLAALVSGPLLMVAVSDGEVELTGNMTQIAKSMVPKKDGVPGLTTPDGRVSFLPFYLITGERYTTYCRIRTGR